MSLISILTPKGKNGFGYGSTAEEVTEGLSLQGKTFLVTGCNSGLGKETIRVLSLRGANIIGTARTKQKAEEAGKEVVKGEFTGLSCELSQPDNIRECIFQIKSQKITLDGIICNAGIMALPKLETAFGYELQFFTNHIGHFILVTGLLDTISSNGRVIVVSSSAHNMAPKGGIEFDNLDGKNGYTPWTAYGQSKFCNVLFAKELAERFKGTSKLAFSLHPGVIQTNLSRHMPSIAQIGFSFLGPIFLKSIQEGAATQCYLATSQNIASDSGNFFADCNPKKTRRDAENIQTAKKLWEISEEIITKV